MKKAILLCLTLMAATFGFAQQQLATLNHNDSITVYYGATALQQAYNASVDGDIITLSSGSYPAIYLNKAVTIRGAGMYFDTLVGTSPTVITGDFTITHPSGTASNHIKLEGIRFTGNIGYFSISHPEFIKCELNTINYTGDNNSTEMTNATFINCVIEGLEIGCAGYFWGFYSRHIRNSTFINSAVLSLYYSYGENIYYQSSILSGGYPSNDYYISSDGTYNTFNNCILRLHPKEVQYYAINNSILYYNVADSSNSSVTYNSIGINYDSTQTNYFGSSIIGWQNLHNYNSFSSVFKTFTGTYTSGRTSFELQNNVANSILGSDSTQVGLYGGIMPFNPSVTGLNIRRWNVANRTTPDGKLAIDIEIVNDDATAEDNN